MSAIESGRNILVTGALGQIGSELVAALQARYGVERVIASDLRSGAPSATAVGRLVHMDCTDPQQILETVRRNDVGAIFHLAAMLSAAAESRPQSAWSLNMSSLYNVLEVARQYECSLFFPSSIGAFGPSTPRMNTPQVTVQRPNTIYGVTKVAGELLCDYYASRFGLDTRGLRLPGLVSHVTPPGGGTTDYAVEIYHSAVRYRHYTCFLDPNACLDFMYMPDAIAAMIALMEADAAGLRYRNAYNITAMSVSPHNIASAIRSHITDFAIDYEIDPVRQAIADSWPQSIDASAAREDWGFAPEYDLAAMTADMLARLRERLERSRQGSA